MSLSVFNSLMTVSNIHDISRRQPARNTLAQQASSGSETNGAGLVAQPPSPIRTWRLNAVTASAPSSADIMSVDAANAAYAAQGSLTDANEAGSTSLGQPEQSASAATPT